MPVNAWFHSIRGKPPLTTYQSWQCSHGVMPRCCDLQVLFWRPADSCPCPAGPRSSQPQAAVVLARVSLLANSTNTQREDTPSAISQLFLVSNDFPGSTSQGRLQKGLAWPLCQDRTSSNRCQPRFEEVDDKHTRVPSTSLGCFSSIFLLSFPFTCRVVANARPKAPHHPLCPQAATERMQSWQCWHEETGSSQDHGQESVIITEHGDIAPKMR